MASDITPEQIALQQQLNDAYRTGREDLDAIRELRQKLKELSLAELKTLKDHAATSEKVKGILEAMIEAENRSLENARQRVAEAQKYIQQLEKMGEFEGKSQLINEARRDSLRDQIKAIDHQIEQHRELGEMGEENFKRLLKERDELQKHSDILEENRQLSTQAKNTQIQFGLGMKEAAGFGRTLAASLSEDGGIAATMYAAATAMNHALGVTKKFASQITGGLELSITGLISKMLEMGLEFDKTIKNFERSTMLGDSFSESMQTTAETTAQYGVSMEEASKAHMDLIQNTTVFTLATGRQRQALADTAAVMAELGVQTADFAKGVENSMKFFGKSMAQAEEVQRSLLATAQELQVIPGELSAQFGRMGPQLAKFGDQGVEVFKELAAVAKQTGMEMEKILNITNQFDTFEGAAEMTGKLNAALGGNFVNAMDMMMDTDPASRFESIRDAITGAGLSFDTMSYYQKQFFANSLGLGSVGDLALMMSGNLEGVAGASEMTAAEYEEMAAQAQIVQSIQEKFQATIAKFFMENKDQIMSLIDSLQTFLQTLLENGEKIGMWIKLIISAKFAIGAMTFVMALLRTATAQQAAVTTIQTINIAANTAAEGTNTAAKVLSITTTQTQTAATGGLTAALRGLSVSSKIAALGIGTLMLALIAFAVMGLLMSSPSKLVIAILLLIAGIYGIGVASKMSHKKIRKLGVAAKKAGVGLLMMGTGLALVALSFAQMNFAQGLVLIGFLVTLNFIMKPLRKELMKLIPVLQGAFVPLSAIATTMALFAFALSLVPVENLVALGVAMWAFSAAAKPMAQGIKALAKAAERGAVGMGILLAVLLAVGLVVTGVGYVFEQLFGLFTTLPAEEILMAALSMTLLAYSVQILAGAIITLGVGGQAAAMGLLIVTAVILVFTVAVSVVIRLLQGLVVAFTELMKQFTPEKLEGFSTFASTLSKSAPGLIAAAGGFSTLGGGLYMMGMGMKFISAEKLESLGTFITGVAATDFTGFNEFAQNLGPMAKGAEELAGTNLPVTLVGIGAALGTINPAKMSVLNDTLVQMTSVSIEGLNALADAIRGIGEAMNAVPAVKAIAFTSVLASAAVAAVAIKVLQTGSQAVQAATGGGGGGGFFGGGGKAQNDTIKVEISLDGELFEERVIEIARDESGRITREAIRNER